MTRFLRIAAIVGDLACAIGVVVALVHGWQQHNVTIVSAVACAYLLGRRSEGG